jgi:FlaA1/EpsC-like NDP-sugar epimerase
VKNNRHTDIWIERACHVAAVAFSLCAAFLLRFDFAIPADVIPTIRQTVLIAVLVKLPIFDWIGFYRGLRRFASTPDLYLVFLGNLIGSTVFAAVALLWIGAAIPRSVFLIDALLCFLATDLCASPRESSKSRSFKRLQRRSARESSYMALARPAQNSFAKSAPIRE